MRAVFGFMLGLTLLIPLIGGCGPRLSDEDLGIVVEDIGAEVPGAGERYDVPGVNLDPDLDPMDQLEEGLAPEDVEGSDP